MDLLRFSKSIGGLDRVYTVLQELGENVDSSKLLAAAKADGNLTYAQRAGWLLEKAGFSKAVEKLAGWLVKKNLIPAKLDPARSGDKRSIQGQSLGYRGQRHGGGRPVIPRAHIVAWRQVAPRVSDAQLEQDLIMSPALVTIFENSALASSLAFRGGTALHKLYFKQARRYSEFQGVYEGSEL